MKILVTGAAGFIGFHLCKKLIDEGFQVYGIDNLNSYYEVQLKLDRLEQLGIDTLSESFLSKIENQSSFSNFLFWQIDLVDDKKLDNLFLKEQFDIVVNLAAQAGVRYSIENPKVYVQSNIVGFINILEACRQNNIKHLIYASSSSVYGNQEKVPFSESDYVDHPISLYAATKKSNELMAHVYSHLYKIKTTGLRFFTVYGTWGRPDMAPFLFTKAIMNGEPIKVFNNGDLMRDFTFIDDIIQGIYNVLKSNNCDNTYQVLNIGNNSPVKLLDFIRTLEISCEKEALIQWYPMQAGDVFKTFADTNQIELKYLFKPKTTLKDGIEAFVKWYKFYYKLDV